MKSYGTLPGKSSRKKFLERIDPKKETRHKHRVIQAKEIEVSGPTNVPTVSCRPYNEVLYCRDSFVLLHDQVEVEPLRPSPSLRFKKKNRVSPLPRYSTRLLRTRTKPNQRNHRTSHIYQLSRRLNQNRRRTLREEKTTISCSGKNDDKVCVVLLCYSAAKPYLQGKMIT